MNTTSVKTAELSGVALDWAVAQCEGWEQGRIFLLGEPIKHVRISNLPDIEHTYLYSFRYSPSSNWAQGGPIIEREKINLAAPSPIHEEWTAMTWLNRSKQDGPTPLTAAMLCYVASKLGDVVEIPATLFQEAKCET